MRGQGYDGAVNIAGKYKGAQARIREVVPGAIYTHCKAHNLNLSIIHACGECYENNSRKKHSYLTILGNVKTVTNLTILEKVIKCFKDKLATDYTARANLEEKAKTSI